MGKTVWPGGVPKGHNGSKRNHFACLVASLEACDVVGLHPKAILGLGEDLIGAAQIIEIVDVCRSEINLHCLEHPLGGHPELCRPDSVYVCEDVWRGAAKRRKHTSQTWIGIRRGSQAPCCRFQGNRPEISLVLQHHLETA